VGYQQPLQAGAIGQTGKQGVIVSLEPAIKGTKVTSFQREQQANRDQLAWVQFGLRLAETILTFFRPGKP